MILSASQIRSITKGAAMIREVENGLRFDRFTQRELDMYQATNADFYKKAQSSAGIRLEFKTDSRRLAFSALTAPGSSRPFCHFDLYRDGVFFAQIGSNQIDSALSGEFDLGKGEKEIRLYFPWSASTLLQSVTLDDGATLIPLKKERTMLIYGDSITQGYDTHHPSLSYASLLTDALEAEAFNKAIGGEFFNPALAKSAEAENPDLITVAYGTNDWSKKTLEEFEANCAEFYTTLSKKYPNSKIFALTPIWRADWDQRITGVGEFPHVAEHIQKVAASLPNVTVLTGFDWVPKEESYFADRYLHPNDQGFIHYFQGLYQAIKQYL
jgi:lysophospholipase L1-like esterase